MRAALVVLLLVAAPLHAEPELDAPQVYQALKEGRVTVIDIRTVREWRETGVVPGARRVDFYEGPEVLLKSVLEMVDGDRTRPIALVCRTGNRTAQAQKLLQAHGFTQVYNVREGMAGSAGGPGWLRRGLPVEPCHC